MLLSLLWTFILFPLYSTKCTKRVNRKEMDKPFFENSYNLSIHFSDIQPINLTMNQFYTMEFSIICFIQNQSLITFWDTDSIIRVMSSDEDVIHVTNYTVIYKHVNSKTITELQWRVNCTIKAKFLGHAFIYVKFDLPTKKQNLFTMDKVYVIVTRHNSIMDIIYKAIVACFVIILYINFGAVLDINILKQILTKPIGPAIGFVGQFVIMPILSYIIGYLLFRDLIPLRLGLFFVGSTPGGGGSNLFTVILKANLNLSIIMTTISNLVAFGMMPLWIFTLGALISDSDNLTIPYMTVAYMSCSLLVPLSLGIILQKCSPYIAKLMSRLLRPLSFCMIIIITFFGITTNTYIFKLFTWKIIIASSALPWSGYIFGWILAKICRQSSDDALTIAIETGIQNIGIAIFMLNFTLPQPYADLTSVVPVANTLLTPLPLCLIYCYRHKAKTCHNCETFNNI